MKKRKQESIERAERDTRKNVVRITIPVPGDVHALASEIASRELNQITSVLARMLIAGAATMGGS